MKLSKSTICAALSASTVGAFTVSNTPRFAARGLTTRNMADMPHSDEDMVFYALGVNLAKQLGDGQLKTLLEDSEMSLVVEGFSDTMKGEGTVDGQMVLMTYGMQLNEVLTSRSAGISGKIKAEGEEFIANFLDCNEDAVKTDSGLVYLSMTEGDGKQPTVADTVEVHYHGTLIDGTVFDSSVQRGQTISFPLGNVIKGWQEGLAMMKEGGKATLVIPSDLAYGDAGTGDAIPGGATLKFEVELFKVN